MRYAAMILLALAVTPAASNDGADPVLLQSERVKLQRASVPAQKRREVDAKVQEIDAALIRRIAERRVAPPQLATFLSAVCGESQQDPIKSALLNVAPQACTPGLTQFVPRVSVPEPRLVAAAQLFTSRDCGNEAWECETNVDNRSGTIDSRCSGHAGSWACYAEITETCRDRNSDRTSTRSYRNFTGRCGSLSDCW